LIHKHQLITVLVIVLVSFNLMTFSQDNFETEKLKILNGKYFNIQKLIEKKKYKIAANLCQSIIKKDMEFYPIYLLYVNLSKENKTLDNTIVFLKKMLKSSNNSYIYFGLGLCFEAKEDKTEAIKNFKNAIDLNAPFLNVYKKLASYIRPDSSEDILNYFKNKMNKNPDNFFLSLQMAEIYGYKLKKRETALEYFNKALEVVNKKGDKNLEGIYYNSIGSFHFYKTGLNTALKYYKKAVDVISSTEDVDSLGSALYNVGLIRCYQGDFTGAIKDYQKALDNATIIQNKRKEAKYLRGIGLNYCRLDNLKEGLNYYKKARNTAVESGDLKANGKYLSDIAIVYGIKGDFKKSIKYYLEALKIARMRSDIYRELWIMNDLGVNYKNAGKYNKALDYYFQILKKTKTIAKKIPYTEQKIYIDIGTVYMKLHNYDQALKYLQLAYRFLKKKGSKDLLSRCLKDIAYVYIYKREFLQAIDYLDKSLAFIREMKVKKSHIIALLYKASIYIKLKKYQKALEELNEANILIRKKKKMSLQLRHNLLIGTINYHLGKYNDSKKIFNQIIKVSKNLNFYEIQIKAYDKLAKISQIENKLNIAISYYKKALNIIENIRDRIQQQELKSFYSQSYINIYNDFINLLYKLHKQKPSKGYDRLCFFYIEKATARTFLENLQENKNLFNKNLNPELKEEITDVTYKISQFQTKLIKLGDKKKKQTIIDQLLMHEDKYQLLKEKIKRENPQYAQFAYHEPRTLENIQSMLPDKKTAIIEYFIYKQNAFIVLISNKNFTIHKLHFSNIKQKRISYYIRLLSQNKNKEFPGIAAGKKLFKELLGQVSDNIKKINRLIIIPHGQLHYFPFESLVFPRGKLEGKFIVEKYSISYAPSASSLFNILNREKGIIPEKHFLGFADPYYKIMQDKTDVILDDTISRGYYKDNKDKFPSLKYSREEVKKISRLFKGKIYENYFGKKATEEKIKSLRLEDFRIIHFATHGFLDQNVPARSSIVFTLDEDPQEDGFFQVREIYETKLNADMVVLSACNTGKGKLVRGEGILGLYRAFLIAGARSVVMSLWSINDKVTSIFMKHFYKLMLKGRTKVDALRLTKIKMIRSKFNHPSYWAPFILTGDSDSVIK